MYYQNHESAFVGSLDASQGGTNVRNQFYYNSELFKVRKNGYEQVSRDRLRKEEAKKFGIGGFWFWGCA